MAITGDALDVILRVQNLRSFTRGMRTASAEVRAVGRAAKQTNAEQAAMGKGTGALLAAGKAARWGAVGVAAMAVESYRLNVNFNRDMTQVQTMAGAGAGEIANLRQQVLDLDAAQTPDELAKGLYHIESIGLRGQKAMDALKAASEGAALGNTDLESTATALGSALLVKMKGGADNAHDAMAQLTAIAGAGNMQMRDLVYALGTGILPAAKVAGLSLQNVGAAIALLVDEGYPASSAAAQLGTALHFLYAPTDKAKGALEGIGLTQGDLVAQLQGKDGLMGALRLLNQQLTVYAGHDRAKRLDILGSILPGGRGRVLIALMNQIDRYGGKINQIEGTSKKFDEHIAVMHQTAAYRLHHSWNRITSAAIQFADVYQGPATDALVFLMEHGIVPLLDGLGKIPGAIKHAVHWYKALPEPIKIVVDAIGLIVAEIVAYQLLTKGWILANALVAASYGFLTGAIETTYLAMLIMMDNPIMLALAALAIILILLVTHWKWFKNAAVSAWHWIKQAGIDTWHWIKRHWGTLKWLTGPWGVAVTWIVHHWGRIKSGARSTIRWIRNAWDNSIHFIGNRFRDLGHLAGRVWHSMTHPSLKGIGGWIIRHGIPGVTPPHGFAQGTMNAPGGWSVVGERGPELLNLPRGASVVPTGMSYFERRRHVPNPQPASDAAPQVIEAHSHIYLDKRKIATAVNRFNSDRRARA